jgi:serine protease inhibitor
MNRYIPWAALLMLAACDSAPPTTPESGSANPGPSVSAPPTTSTSSPPLVASNSAAPTAPPSAPPSSADLAKLAKANNALGLDLYQQIRTKPGNLAFSPLSISTALAMTWAGAKGETATQMQKVLHFEGKADDAADLAGKLVKSLGDTSKPYTLHIANRLFGDKAYSFEKAFLDKTAERFGAPLEALDFVHAADTGREHINAWVATETHDRIKNLIPSGALDTDTRLVLVNALYFKGDWSDPFLEKNTQPAAFHTSKTDQKDVPMMHATESFEFVAADGIKVLELPYKGNDLAMALVLPDAVDGLDAVEKKLTPEVLDGYFSKLSGERVMVTLPKFEIDPPEAMKLGDELKQLGMPLAFDRDKADFSGIANPPNPADRLYIAKVFHKAFVKIDEHGTEAAAATAVDMARAGGVPAKPAEFTADHPFLFFIRDTKSGLILFAGRVSDPSAK